VKKNKFFRTFRWSDDQQVWWRFLYSPASGFVRVGFEIQERGGEYYDENTDARHFNFSTYLHLYAFKRTLLIAIPWFNVPSGRTYGAVWTLDSAIHIKYGCRRMDGSGDREIYWMIPWLNHRFHAEYFYDLDRKLIKTFPGGTSFSVRWNFQESSALPKRSYDLKDYDGEDVIATCYIEGRHWKKGIRWCKWMSWFTKDHHSTSLDIRFSKETGERKGSWKGGTIGHSIEMLPNETADQAMARYCTEHKMTYVGARAEVYVPPPKPPAEEDNSTVAQATP
jgi:hypothetical protein